MAGPLIPLLPGSYVLLLRLAAAQTVAVGRLGCFALAPGVYAYTGSAHGPGGLRARLAHHLRPAPRPHWHIDTLRAVAPVVAVAYSAGSEPCECAWAAALAALPDATRPIPRFGASDCGCAGHLIHAPGLPTFAEALAGVDYDAKLIYFEP